MEGVVAGVKNSPGCVLTALGLAVWNSTFKKCLYATAALSPSPSAGKGFHVDSLEVSESDIETVEDLARAVRSFGRH